MSEQMHETKKSWANRRTTLLKIGFDLVILAVTCGLLFWGAAWKPDARQEDSQTWLLYKTYTDVAKYQCYAEAFLNGLPALKKLPAAQCDFILHPDPKITYIKRAEIIQQMQQWHIPNRLVNIVKQQDPNTPFHALPKEYPLLTLLPFTLSAIGPVEDYQVRYALLMELLVIIVYVLLACFHSRKAAVVAAFYLAVGGWSTAVGRFDMVPALLTLVALIMASRKHWSWSFLFLALATMAKYYPAILLIPFLLAQQGDVVGKWYAWRRWRPLVTFGATCAVLALVSLLLSAEGTLGTLSYFSNRPIQVESTASSSVWIAGIWGVHSTFDKTYGSLNIFSPISDQVSMIGTLLLFAGLLYTYWLQWRGKIELGLACVMILLVILVTGKVFSPQYLIWVAPLIAFISGANWRWVVPWGIISLLTTWIYPLIYTMTRNLKNVPDIPIFFPAVTVRNAFLLLFLLTLFWYGSTRKSNKLAAQEVPKQKSSTVALSQS